MKAILLSVNSRQMANILNGEQTIIIKKILLRCDLPIDVYLYCTKNGEKLIKSFDVDDGPYHTSVKEFFIKESDYLNGKILAKFTLRKIETIFWQKDSLCSDINDQYSLSTDSLSEYQLEQKACLKDTDELADYIGYSLNSFGYAYHITNLEIFDKPKELNEFMLVCRKKKCNGCKYFGGQYQWDILCNHPRPLLKGPQSWCYIQEYWNEDNIFRRQGI